MKSAARNLLGLAIIAFCVCGRLGIVDGSFAFPDASRWNVVTPKADHLWLLVIDDAGQRTAQLGQFLGDVGYWQALAARGHHWRILDADEEKDKAAIAKYQPSIDQAGGLPTLIIADADKRTRLAAMKLTPELQNAAAIDTLIAKYSKDKGGLP